MPPTATPTPTATPQELPAPNNLRRISDLYVAWDPVTGALLGYGVRVRMSGGQWQAHYISETQFQFANAGEYGTYEVQVRALGDGSAYEWEGDTATLQVTLVEPTATPTSTPTATPVTPTDTPTATPVTPTATPRPRDTDPPPRNTDPPPRDTDPPPVRTVPPTVPPTPPCKETCGRTPGTSTWTVTERRRVSFVPCIDEIYQRTLESRTCTWNRSECGDPSTSVWIVEDWKKIGTDYTCGGNPAAAEQGEGAGEAGESVVEPDMSIPPTETPMPTDTPVPPTDTPLAPSDAEEAADQSDEGSTGA